MVEIGSPHGVQNIATQCHSEAERARNLLSQMTTIMPSVGLLTYNGRVMKFEDYKIILYRQENGSWVAEIPALPACYALMKTREQALAEFANVFSMMEDERREKGQQLPADSTEIVNA